MSEYEDFNERLEKQRKKREEMMKKRDGLYRESTYEEFRFSTGIYPVDKACQGIPCGRSIELFGAESSGKTSTSIKIAAEVNKINYDTGKLDLTYSNPCSVLFIDMQNTFSRDWSNTLGFKSDDYGNSVDYVAGGDVACDVVKDLIADDLYSLVIIDSTDEFGPLAVMEGDIGVNDTGLKSRTLARTCRKFLTAQAAASWRNKGCPWKVPSVIYLSPGTPIFMDKYGRYESTAGNNIRLAATQRMFLSKLKVQEEGSPDFGKGSMKVTVKKNKLGSPGYVGEYMIALQDLKNLPRGEIDNVTPIFKDLKDLGLLKKVKTNYEILGETYSTQNEFKEKMYSDLVFQKQVWNEVVSKIGRQGLDFDPTQIEE